MADYVDVQQFQSSDGTVVQCSSGYNRTVNGPTHDEWHAVNPEAGQPVKKALTNDQAVEVRAIVRAIMRTAVGDPHGDRDPLDDVDDYRPIYLDPPRLPDWVVEKMEEGMAHDEARQGVHQVNRGPSVRGPSVISREKFAGLQKKVDKLHSVVMDRLPVVDSNAEEAQRLAHLVDQALARQVGVWSTEHRKLLERIAGLEATIEVLVTGDIEEEPYADTRVITDTGKKPHKQAQYIRGWVKETGGGEVLIVVDRDTMNYPHPGSAVEIRHWA